MVRYSTFRKRWKNDFNHHVDNMTSTSLTKNTELQGALPDNLRLSGKRHCSDMLERSLINESCEHCSKNPDFFHWKRHLVNFSVQKCVGASVSYKSVHFWTHPPLVLTLVWSIAVVVVIDCHYRCIILFSALVLWNAVLSFGGVVVNVD